jgi:hypothetical protein
MNLEDKAVKHLKTGGWKKRGPNKLKTDAGELATSGMLPLDYMLSVMRDPIADPKLRLAMAASALPYCNARFKSVQPPPRKSEIPEKVELVIIDPRQYARSNSLPVSSASDSEDVESPIVGRKRTLGSS